MKRVWTSYDLLRIHTFWYFLIVQKKFLNLFLCFFLRHMWRWCFRGVMQHPRMDRAILTEYCWFDDVINPVTFLIDPCQNCSFQKLLYKDLNSFMPCHQNVCSFFYTSTPGRVSAQHLLQYFEFILFIFCFIFSPDVHFMFKAEGTISRVYCLALLLNHALLN